MFKNVKVKIGKKKCTCSFSLMADGDKLSPKSKAGCDKKCSGTAKGLELEGDSGNVYTLNLKSSKGKVTISQGSVEKGSFIYGKRLDRTAVAFFNTQNVATLGRVG